MKRAIELLVACLATLVATAGQVHAATITFVPPNDTTGMVFSTNSNDGYLDGRGIVFSMQDDVLIDSIGLFHDLTGVNLSYDIAEVTVTSGQVTTGQTILRSGSSVVTTSGLEWIDFPISPLLLTNGTSYHIEFSHAGVGNQNFFYNNGNVRFTEGAFTMVDGTQGGGTGNFVMPAIRVNEVGAAAVPEPTSLALFGIGACVAGMGTARRRRQKKQETAA